MVNKNYLDICIIRFIIMAHYYGLYFGASNLCLAIHKDGKTEVLANAAGDRVTPAVVAFINGEKSIGLPAKLNMYGNANNTVTQVKRLICGGKGCIENEVKRSKCKIIQEDGLKYEIEQDGAKSKYTAFEVLVLLFQNMKEIAKSHSHNEDTYPTVITVPFSISLEQANTIQNAATKAGFHLLRVISESAAAALAYSIGQGNVHSSFYCMVYRMGRTSLDVTVIRVIDGMYSIQAFIQREGFGGSKFTDILADFCAQEFQKRYKADIQTSKRSMMKLQNAAENCKHVLSTLGAAQCFAESIYEGIDLSIHVSRARFESLIGSTLQLSLDPIHEALKLSVLENEDISKVIFAGGSCKIPKLQQLLFDMFPSAIHLCSISPDEVIAIGAAEEASVISENSDNEVGEEECFIKVLRYGIYIKVLDNSHTSSFLQIIPGGSVIPAHFTQKFILPEAQTSFCLEIYENCENYHDDINELRNNSPLAKLNVKNLLGVEVTIAFIVESDYSLHVTCTDEEYNKTQTFFIKFSDKSGSLLQENGKACIDLN